MWFKHSRHRLPHDLLPSMLKFYAPWDSQGVFGPQELDHEANISCYTLVSSAVSGVVFMGSDGHAILALINDLPFITKTSSTRPPNRRSLSTGMPGEYLIDPCHERCCGIFGICCPCNVYSENSSSGMSESM